MADYLSETDQRLIAALQCDGRLSARRAGEVLGLDSRVAQQRIGALLADGTVRVSATPPRAPGLGAMLLRIRVLSGRIDTITAALAAREDVPFIDVSASGDELSAVLLTAPGQHNRLVFQQLPATTAVTSVAAETVLHVYAEAHDWRVDVLTATERAALTVPRPAEPATRITGETDRAIAALLADDGRASAVALAARVGVPESTVRRRVAVLFGRGQLQTTVAVDPRRLGLHVDANLWITLPARHLDATGRALAAHPAVHGALAVTGPASLHLAVWLRDLDDLYRFLTEELAAYPITGVDTVLVGSAAKRPGTAGR
ncbi:Lrp/AsnC family transcriptional regulator [Micromonospora sp. 067-2]|uniref:Lrp/AsnC family transcriptional regulator n=1 Tax=Micromonospora sp. 067-2 TaxID=2789270 RepID=UPI00397D144C